LTYRDVVTRIVLIESTQQNILKRVTNDVTFLTKLSIYQ